MLFTIIVLGYPHQQEVWSHSELITWFKKNSAEYFVAPALVFQSSRDHGKFSLMNLCLKLSNLALHGKKDIIRSNFLNQNLINVESAPPSKASEKLARRVHASEILRTFPKLTPPTNSLFAIQTEWF